MKIKKLPKKLLFQNTEILDPVKRTNKKGIIIKQDIKISYF